jgi:RiboL-PSP-HEPN
MPTPKRLQRLLTRIDKLEAHFLPATFSLTGRYNPQQHDYTKSFLLLVHAELESYFEDRARKLVANAQAQYRRSGMCTPVLSRLLVYHNAAKDELGPVSAQSVSKAVNYYLDHLDKNHGIKEKNLLTIFLPLGISHAALDAQLVAACNQLSQKRGQFAHASFKTHQQVDPKSERENIRLNILPELKNLEKRLKELP